MLWRQHLGPVWIEHRKQQLSWRRGCCSLSQVGELHGLDQFGFVEQFNLDCLRKFNLDCLRSFEFELVVIACYFSNGHGHYDNIVQTVQH